MHGNSDFAGQTCYASERWYAGEQYEPPSGPPPGREYTAPSGPPPGRQYTAPSGPPPQEYALPTGPPPAQAAVSHGYAPPPGTPPTLAHEGPAYSRLTGRRKALLIGINYVGSGNQLSGCINDVRNVENFITQRFGYAEDDIVILTEETGSERGLPTRANILDGMRWLVADARPNDALFFHYSGHGTQVEVPDSADGDGMAEAICPLDFQRAGVVTDLEIFDMLVRPLPEGCRLTAIFDSCHSGTVMNLPYMYSTKGTVKSANNYYTEGGGALTESAMEYARGDSIGAAMSLFSSARGIFSQYTAAETLKKTNTSPADVILWSGCKDAQTSADTQEAGQATGAMSYAFVAALSRHPSISYRDLLVAIREEMHRGGYAQKPQLSASHPIDSALEFLA